MVPKNNRNTGLHTHLLSAPSPTSSGHTTKMKCILTNHALTNFIFHNYS